MKDKPILLFIDTQAFHQYGYDFDHHIFKSILSLSKEKKLTVIMIDVLKKENQKRIEKNLKKSIEKIDGYLKKSDGMMLRNHIVLDENKIISEFQERFDAYLKKIDCINVSANEILQESLFNMYFNCMPPFEDKANKKHEFPDAIMCLTLKKLSEDRHSNIHVISDDGGMKLFCMKHDKFHQYDSLSVFLDFMNKRNKYYTRAKEFIFHKLNEIKGSLKSKVDNQGVEYLGDQLIDGELVDYSLENIELVDSRVIDINDEDADVVVNLIFKFDLVSTVGYVPDEAAKYDNEDGRYYYLDRTETEIVTKNEVEVIITLSVENPDDIFISQEEVGDIDTDIEL